MGISTWLARHTHSLAGKTVAVSGSTGGLGQQLCRHLADLGASLILLDRNEIKASALMQTLRADHPDLSVRFLHVDLEQMDTVRTAAQTLLTLPVDYLILNAGAYSIPRHPCDSGYENVFQINFVAPYYLARTLLPHLHARGGKVVAVGSIAHDYSKTDPDDVDFSTRKKASLVYGNAKRYLMYALPACASKAGDVAIVHPGITFTNITAHYPKVIFAIIKHPMKVIFMSPKKASLCILAGLFTDCQSGEWIGPRLWNVWGLPQKKKLKTATQAEQRQICQRAQDIFSQLSDTKNEKNA